jgi:hypothetical protein
MTIPFIHRSPSPAETELLRLTFSTFCDGSGMLAAGAGGTLPGWRDFERALASHLGGENQEDKSVYDVVVQGGDGTDFGLSVKSHDLKTKFNTLSTTGRVYMELSNALAQFWDELIRLGITRADAESGREAQAIGDGILGLVRRWHQETATAYSRMYPGRTLDIDESVFLSVSYNRPRSGPVYYQLHSFDTTFPPNLRWQFSTDSCIRAEDPLVPGEVLFDWYWKSGGQLKYYPRASTAKFSSPVFALEPLPPVTLERKTALCFPSQWVAAGGTAAMPPSEFAAAIERQLPLLQDRSLQAEAKKLISKLKSARPGKS